MQQNRSKHGLNRGQIREAFVREFLKQNISDIWGIGTGEIIHKESTPEEPRNQIDIVVHNKRFPKVSLATGIDLFFVETVSSFIEVKSRLTKDALRTTAAVTRKIKCQAELAPQRFNPTGLVETPRPYSFVFSYEGPKRIETVYNWLNEISKEDEYGLDDLKATEPAKRRFFKHHFVDGVFILGQGFVLLDSVPFESQIGRAIKGGFNVSRSEVWVRGSGQELLVLWAMINGVNAALLWNEVDFTNYIGQIQFIINEAHETC